MINRDELNKLLSGIQTIQLSRIQKITEASKLVDNIRIEFDSNDNDNYIEYLIRHEKYYRDTLTKLDHEFAELEKELWEELLHINKEEE